MVDSGSCGSPQVDNLGDVAVILLDRVGNIDFISELGCHLLGVPFAQLASRNLCELCHSPASREVCLSLFTQVLEGRRAFALATLPMAGFGPQPERSLTLRLEPRFDTDGAISGCLCLVTERAQRDSELANWQHSDAFAAAVLDNAMEAIVTIDSGGVIFSVNNATEEIFGYRSEELLGRNIRSLMPPPYKDEDGRYLQSYIDTDESHIIGTRREVTGRHKDGTLIPLELSISEVEINGERGFAGMLRDIREHKAAEAREEEIQVARERLQQLDRVNVANQLATGIAHEINQPLATIGTYVRIGRELLGKGTGDQQDLLGLLDKIDQQTSHAAEIIRSLRNIISRSPDTHQAVDINLLIEQTLELVRQDIVSSNIDIETLLAENLPEVDVIYVQIQQVILNLIRNSLDVLRSGGHPHPRIEIESRQGEEGFVTVVVRDNGDGVSHAEAEKIFEPFYSTRRGDENMGMGLPICQSILEHHGGALYLNLEYLEGAEFSFTLPTMMHFQAGEADD